MDNIGNCTKAKSVLNVLGPIANQVVELRGKQGIVCDATAIVNLLKQCQSLKTSCNLLVSRLSSYAHCHKDILLSTEVQCVRDQLDRVIGSLTDFTKDLHRGGDVGIRNNGEVWSDIVEDTEILLSILTEALLAWDRAQVRRITNAISHLHERLTHLHQSHYVQRLPEDFQEVVSACGELLNLIELRCGDLYRRAQSETLQLLALQLCHTLSLLATTCAATVSYPLSKQVKASRELVLNRLQTLLRDLEFQAGQGSDDYDMEEAGTFISCVDKTLDLLVGVDKPSEPSSEPLVSLSECVKSLLEEVLQHGVAVAYCSSHDDNRVIMSVCENVLKQLKNLVDLEQLDSRDAVDFQVACDILGDSVEMLEQKVNTALIRQIVKTFAVPLVALEALLRTLEPDQKNISAKAMEDLIADFDLHVDHIFQVGGFAAACTSDLSRVRFIRDSLLTLEWLESCLIPSIVSARNDCHPHAQAHAHMLAKHWTMAVIQLRNTLDQIMDPSAFCLVTKQEIHHAWALLKEKLYTQDTSWISKQVENVVTLSLRIQALNRLDNFLTDLQEEDLRVAISEMNKSLASVVTSPTDLSRHRSMIKRVQLTLTLVSRLASSLNEDNLQYMEEFSYAGQKISSHKGETMSKLTGSERHNLLTSNISDIPIDVATPFSALPVCKTSNDESTQDENNFRQPKQLSRSSKSASKLGEGRFKSTTSNLSAQGNHSRSLQAITSETVGMDTSFDITKFLSRSTNTLPSSARSSKRNFSLKVKEINVDIDGAIRRTDLPPLPYTDAKRDPSEGQLEHTETSMSSEAYRSSVAKSVCEVSELIAKEKSPLTSQQSFGDELTGIFENLTSLAGNLTGLTTPSNKKRKYSWENFSDGEKENASSSSSLHGIKLQNMSFNPQFPEIKDKNTSEVMFDIENPKNCSESEKCAGKSPDHNARGFVDAIIWKDFTVILETKTPAKTNPFNFSSTFSGWQPCTQGSFTTFGKNITTTPLNDSFIHRKVVDLSDTPFLLKASPQIFGLGNISGNISDPLTSNSSVSPSSATFGTPQRLKDIQLVQQRLKTLKDTMK